MPDIHETGPIDWLVLEFPADKQLNGALVPPLLDLVDRRIIRLLDAVIVLKRDDGSVTTLTTEELDPADVGDLGALAGASSGLIDDDDAASVAELLDAGRSALVLLNESAWAVPFAVAAREAGGQVVSNGRIPVQAIVARLDQLEA
jgi:uncharacterized membrane protein